MTELSDADRCVLKFLSAKLSATAFEVGCHIEDRDAHHDRLSNGGRKAVARLVRDGLAEQQFDRGLHLYFYSISAAGRIALQSDSISADGVGP